MEQELRFGLDLGRFGNFWGLFFHVFMGKKNWIKNILVSAPQRCIKWRFFFLSKNFWKLFLIFYRIRKILSCSTRETSPRDFSIISLVANCALLIQTVISPFCFSILISIKNFYIIKTKQKIFRYSKFMKTCDNLYQGLLV